ncbi:MAG: thrombospondin type 3 repeat-containing protein, partial [bacterium]|nr:thrombospondin type 3 repeat-containing protein [bacterium]
MAAVFVCIVLAPGTLFAVENAGLVNGIWFSEQSIVENVPVRIFAAVLNETDATLEGAVVFFADGVEIGSGSVAVRRNSIGRASIEHAFESAGEFTITTQFEPIGGGEFLYTDVPGRRISVDTDTDNDGIGNKEDTDDDNDGILDKDDAEPLVKNEPQSEPPGSVFDSVTQSSSTQAVLNAIFGTSTDATTTSRTAEGARTVARTVAGAA